MWGVTERVAREHGYTGPMRDLPREVAKDIYRKSYWDECSCDRLPEKLAGCVFKECVNEGTEEIKLCLQRALGVTVDGKIGPQTIHAANAYPSPNELIALFLAECGLYYITRPGFPRYGRGWLKRLFLVSMES